MRCLLYAVCWKIRGLVFFQFKTIIDLKHLENTINTLISLSMATRNPKKKTSKKNQFKAKIIIAVRFAFLGKKKEKRHLGQTTLMNPLKPK